VKVFNFILSNVHHSEYNLWDRLLVASFSFEYLDIVCKLFHYFNMLFLVLSIVEVDKYILVRIAHNFVKGITDKLNNAFFIGLNLRLRLA